MFFSTFPSDKLQMEFLKLTIYIYLSSASKKEKRGGGRNCLNNFFQVQLFKASLFNAMKEKTYSSIHNNSAFKQHPLITIQIAQPLTQYIFLCLSFRCQACKFRSAPLFCQNQKIHFMSAKQLFYEGRIMELQSILNEILSVSQVDLF